MLKLVTAVLSSRISRARTDYEASHYQQKDNKVCAGNVVVKGNEIHLPGTKACESARDMKEGNVSDVVKPAASSTQSSMWKIKMSKLIQEIASACSINGVDVRTPNRQ